MSKLTATETRSVDRKQTKGFALEDDNGAIVKVFVPMEQSADFERALATTLDDHLEDETEIAEILHNLRKDFDIVDVSWSEDAIPEDEEGDIPAEGDAVDADVEGPDGEMATGSEDAGGLGGEGAGGEDDPMQANDTDVPGPSGSAPSDDAGLSALDKIIDMMSADAEARKAEADARKAEAAVQAGQVAAQAASARSKAEEEIMDMENYNKRSKEEKRERDLRGKVIRYRHDQRMDSQGGIGSDGVGQGNGENQAGGMGESVQFSSFLLGEGKYAPATPEEEEIMDMEDEAVAATEAGVDDVKRSQLIRHRHDKMKKRKSKAVKEGMFDAKYPVATEEEQELLDMEDHTTNELERKKREATREKLLKFRHQSKKSGSKLSFSEFNKTSEESGGESGGESGEPKTATVDDVVAQIDLSHRVQA